MLEILHSIQEAQAGGSGIEGHPWLHSEFEARLH